MTEVSRQRHEKTMRFRHERDRKLLLAAYLLLKRGLRLEYGLSENPVFTYGDHGKPHIEGHPDIHFNLSHSKTVAMCVIDRQPVGADVEVIRPVNTDMIAYAMNDEERDWILASPDTDTAFLTLWTRKEAVIKLTGQGIRHSLKDVLSHSEAYRLETVQTPNYIYSIAKFR